MRMLKMAILSSCYGEGQERAIENWFSIPQPPKNIRACIPLMDAKLSHKVKEAAIVPLDLGLRFSSGHVRFECLLVVHICLMVGEAP